VQVETRSRAALDRARILEAGLELVDAHGLAALSMRKLGAALGVEAMALYYHVPNKAALIEGIAELVLGQLELPTDYSADWAQSIRAVARSFRQLGRAHPNVFPLLATVGFSNPSTVRPAETVLEVLCRAGLEPAAAFVAFVTLKSFVVGHTVWAIGEPYSAAAERDGAIGDEPLPPLSPDEYPRLAAFATELAETQVETEFERGLDLIIDGIRARLSPAESQ
jgi:AcrR family transcriptional regulator